MAQQFFNRNIADECHQQMRAFAAAGNEVTRVAFAPGGGNRFSILTRNGAYFNRNIPDECHRQMAALSAQGARIVCVAFPPGGGDSFSIVNDRGQFFNRNIPDECHRAMVDLQRGGARIVQVAFPPQGGNRWSVLCADGRYVNRNIPEECHQFMAQLSQGGARVICVAFDKDGSGYSVVNDRGAYLNRNIPDEAHMIMGYYSQIHGPVRSVSFDGDGNGWSVIHAQTKDEKVCDAARCVDISEAYAQIRARLDGKVVGYACTVGAGSIGAFSAGHARTAADAPAVPYLPSTKTPTASVSKFIGALGTIAVLARHGVSLDSAVGPWLPPDWAVNAQMAQITFRQLLAQRSGIKQYGNNDQTYDTIKAFWQAPQAGDFNAADKSWAYSNYNFSILRVLLPRVAGFVDDPANRARRYAESFIRLVQQHVFEKVGVHGVDAKPPASGPQARGYAYSYKFPGTAPGHDWGDNTLAVGPACWYLSIDDVAQVLYSLNCNDGRILTRDQMAELERDGLGLDVRRDANGYRWLEKNGGWGWGGTSISTSVCLFGPGVFGALFINSDTANGGPDAATALHDALVAAYKPRA